MIGWFFQLSLALCLATGVFNLILAAFKRKPSVLSMAMTTISILVLLAQFVVTVALLFAGESSVGSLGEFLGYLLVALLLPLGSIAWSLVERTNQSTAILGLAPLVVAVMLYRMMTIWSGQ